MYVLVVLLVIALVVILMWFKKESDVVHSEEDLSTVPAMILAAWIISSAVFGPFFYVFRLAGFFDITIERLLFAMVIVLLIIGFFRGKFRFQENYSIEIVMGSFLLVCVASMLRTGFLPAYSQFPSPWFTFITGYLFPFVVFLYAKEYIFREGDVTLLLKTLFYFGIYLCIISYLEFSNLRQFVYPQYINDPLVSPLHLERARGPFLNGGFNGLAILIGFISGFHLLQKQSGFSRIFHQIALLLFFPAVFFTLTRMVYLGMLITLIIFLVWYRTSISKWKLISLPLAAVLILGIAISPRLLSTERREGGVYQVAEVNVRLALLQRSFLLFTEQPLTGIGLSQFIPGSLRLYKGPAPFAVEEAGSQYQHNHLLGIATELGILGLLLYLAFVVLVFRRLWQLSEKLPETGVVGNNLRIAVLAIWCVYLNINLFMEPSVSLFANAVPYLFAGIMDGLYTRSLEIESLHERSASPGLTSTSPIRMVGDHV